MAGRESCTIIDWVELCPVQKSWDRGKSEVVTAARLQMYETANVESFERLGCFEMPTSTSHWFQEQGASVRWGSPSPETAAALAPWSVRRSPAPAAAEACSVCAWAWARRGPRPAARASKKSLVAVRSDKFQPPPDHQQPSISPLPRPLPTFEIPREPSQTPRHTSKCQQHPRAPP